MPIPHMPLLYALRNDLKLSNPASQAAVSRNAAPAPSNIDRQPVRSCVTPVSAIGNGKVVTLAGLGTADNHHPVQRAYVAGSRCRNAAIASTAGS